MARWPAAEGSSWIGSSTGVDKSHAPLSAELRENDVDIRTRGGYCQKQTSYIASASEFSSIFGGCRVSQMVYESSPLFSKIFGVLIRIEDSFVAS